MKRKSLLYFLKVIYYIRLAMSVFIVIIDDDDDYVYICNMKCRFAAVDITHNNNIHNLLSYDHYYYHNEFCNSKNMAVKVNELQM